MSNAREGALAFVAGREVDEIVDLGEEIYDELMADKIWPGTRALAQRHLDAGQRVWLVTATPVELAQIIGAPARADRRAGHRRGERGRRLHRPAGRRDAARPGEGRRGPRAGRPRGARPAALHRLLGLGQRRPDAVGGRHRGRDQPGRRPEGRRARSAAGRSRTSAPAARPPRSGRRWSSAPVRSAPRCWSAGRSSASTRTPLNRDLARRQGRQRNPASILTASPTTWRRGDQRPASLVGVSREKDVRGASSSR